MIYVNRTLVNLPISLTEILDAATNRAAKFFLVDQKKRGQQRFGFEPKLWNEVRKYLLKLFHSKCAFCESLITSTRNGDTEHYRPRVEAMGLDGKSDPDWYWWLAYEWKNLYYVCSVCDKNKGNQFPVVGRRAKQRAKGKTLAGEKALLLDPCTDRPELYLAFSNDGSVYSTSHPDPVMQDRYENLDRGSITIEILGLNRPDLLRTRSKESDAIHAVFEAIMSSASGQRKHTLLEGLLEPPQPYLGMRRQILARLINENREKIESQPRIKKILGELFFSLKAELRAIDLRNRTPRARKVIKHTQTTYEAAYIKRVSIRNFRAIQELDFEFNDSGPQSGDSQPVGVSWKMLLGENGAGKSSVLKAISLALTGEDFYKERVASLRIEPGRIFCSKTRQKDGMIRVELSKGDPVEVQFNKKALKFSSGRMGAERIFLRGYGATRLLSERDVDAVAARAQKPKDVDNLFRADVRLGDADKWLTSLNRNQFNSAGLTLKDLLHLEAETPLQKKGGRVYLDAGHGPLPLDEQSDGYQSVLALATDIMAGVPGSLHDKQQASGIVLLDEIDAHLHPRWKMWIVKRLRGCFPNIQFIATTHEPLCLRGLGDNEIAVMRREADRITVFEVPTSPSELRVDQLLTSELFGLSSTIDPDIDARFQEYYDLLARHDLSNVHQKRRDELKRDLERYNKIGFTRRDQLAYEVIDQYIAKELKDPDVMRRRELREETKLEVARIWGYVSTRRRGRL